MNGRAPLRDLAARDLSPKELYEFLTRLVCPRPIAFVSSVDAQGQVNLAPFSYFTAGGLQPPSVVFCAVADRRGRIKDTLHNIRETGEYVINVVTREITEPMNEASANFPHGVNEFEEAGFTAEPSLQVRPPRVLESPLSMECRRHTIVECGDGPLAGHFVIGEVLTFRVREDVLDPAGYPDPAKVGFVGRLGGNDYVHVRPDSLFQLARPESKRIPNA